MKTPDFDFYSKKSLKSYNLNESMRYQLAMLDSLDPFTRKHSENVANITCRLCEHLHLKTDFVIYATICAYLHDVGKLFISPKILQKNGPLTDEEYEIIKTHTTIGHKLCKEDPKLRPYAAGTIYHHEALNGSGYPNKLTKKDIPLEGQIIRVADEFDAIVSKRQYKSHIGITDTLKLLVEEAQPIPNSVALKSIETNANLGKLNPKVVRALFKVVIEDTEYEISGILNYMKHLKVQIKRLERINGYNIKLQKAKNTKKKEDITFTIENLFDGGENFRNYIFVLEEYRTAYSRKKETVNNLRNEILEIKKLRV